MRALIVAIVACAASVAAADTPPKPGSKAALVEAQKHYKQGQAYLDLAAQNHDDPKIYDDAIAEFEESYRLSLLPDVIYYIAQVYRKKGDEDRALEKYKHFVDLKPSGELADKAREWIAQLSVEKQKRDEAAARKREDDARRAEEDRKRREAETAAAAERTRLDQIRGKEDAERHAREEQDRKRREEEERAQAEIRQRQAAEAAARYDWESRREMKHKRRAKGYKLAGVGVGFFAVSAGLAIAGASQYSHVQSGGFATAGDIRGTITTGQVLDGFAIGLVVPGLIFTALGVPRIFGNRDPGVYKVSAMAGNHAGGLVLSGPLP